VTTAAGIWVVGAIGVACGGGYYALAGLTALFTLFILSGVNVIERRLIRRTSRRKE
jgi:putative Mg2+ transporter-C (MgtC) family protein